MNKKLFWVLISLGVIIFVGGPLLVQYNHWSLGYRGSGDWLSFWGSYLGFLPAGLITYIVLDIQFKRQSKIDNKNAEYRRKAQLEEFLFEKNFEFIEAALEVTVSLELKLHKLAGFFKIGPTSNDQLAEQWQNEFRNDLFEVGIEILSLEKSVRKSSLEVENELLPIISDTKFKIRFLNEGTLDIKKNIFTITGYKGKFYEPKEYVMSEVENEVTDAIECIGNIKAKLFKNISEYRQKMNDKLSA